MTVTTPNPYYSPGSSDYCGNCKLPVSRLVCVRSGGLAALLCPRYAVDTQREPGRRAQLPPPIPGRPSMSMVGAPLIRC